jgi:hypothetical protein
MLKAEMWAHGTAFQPEESLAFSARRGWGAFFRGNPSVFEGASQRWLGPPTVSHWFHAALPTPVILDGVRPRFTRFFLLYHGDQAWLRQVHLWDGARRLHGFDLSGVNATGTHQHEIDDLNTFRLDESKTVRFGLGISVQVEFQRGQLSNLQLGGGEILFSAAGADFEV